MKIFKDKVVIIASATALAFGLIFFFAVVSPILSKNRSLSEKINIMEADLAKMTSLKKEWENFQETRTKAEGIIIKRGKNFSLLSFLEGIAREQGIDLNIKYIKPISFAESNGPLRLDGIEMKLNDIQIGQLTNFLFKIENAEKLMRIHRIKITRTTEGGLSSLEVTLQVDTYLDSI